MIILVCYPRSFKRESFSRSQSLLAFFITFGIDEMRLFVAMAVRIISIGQHKFAIITVGARNSTFATALSRTGLLRFL